MKDNVRRDGGTEASRSSHRHRWTDSVSGLYYCYIRFVYSVVSVTLMLYIAVLRNTLSSGPSLPTGVNSLSVFLSILHFLLNLVPKTEICIYT